jgi:hypothetical protein
MSVAGPVWLSSGRPSSQPGLAWRKLEVHGGVERAASPSADARRTGRVPQRQPTDHRHLEVPAQGPPLSASGASCASAQATSRRGWKPTPTRHRSRQHRTHAAPAEKPRSGACVKASGNAVWLGASAACAGRDGGEDADGLGGWDGGLWPGAVGGAFELVVAHLAFDRAGEAAQAALGHRHGQQLVDHHADGGGDLLRGKRPAPRSPDGG